MIGKDLDLDVARPIDVFFEIDRVVAEGIARFTLCGF